MGVQKLYARGKDPPAQLFPRFSQQVNEEQFIQGGRRTSRA
ncbi:hypothetical protein [Streptomyces sp. NPDC046978]